MRRLFPGCLLLCAALFLGCGSSDADKKADKKNGAAAAPGPARERITVETLGRIRIGDSKYPDVCQILTGSGEPTNVDKPGLMGGNKYVWTEGNKKVYVSFSPIDHKANGISWEGFGGK
jgi:hypothetical protein